MAEPRHTVSGRKSHLAAQVDCTREVLGSHLDAEVYIKHSHDTFSQERAFTTEAPWSPSECATGTCIPGAG